jgi:hypothetical protein
MALAKSNRGRAIAMAFDATFNNISVISWRLALLVDETGILVENHRPAANHCQSPTPSNPTSFPLTIPLSFSPSLPLFP